MRRDINFFSVYRTPQSESEARTFNIIAAILLAGSLAVMLTVFGILKISSHRVESANKSNQSYLASSEVSKINSQIQDAKSKMSAINLYKRAALRVSKNFSSLPQPDSELLAFIASKLPSGATADAISYDNGTLTLQCSCKDNLSAAVFVHTLEESGRFRSVNYSGILKANENSRFTFSVKIALKGGSGK